MLLSSLLACALISDGAYVSRMDMDGDGVLRPDDCDDADPHAGVAADQFPDADGDGYGAGNPTTGCGVTTGFVYNADDCDDLSASVNPSATETCDGVDNDCDGEADGSGVPGGSTWYLDEDQDGYGRPATAVESCPALPGYVEVGGDCADDDPDLSPAAEDVPDDGLDQNCDGWDALSYVTSFGSEMRWIPGGMFTMGGGRGDPGDGAQDHEVTLTRAFWIGRTELTQAAWMLSPGEAGKVFQHPGCDECPADTLSWYSAAMYANALSAAEGFAPCYLEDGTDLAPEWLDDPYACPGYRLPTEAEWEYAARAGVDTRFAGSDELDAVAWSGENSGGVSHEVCLLAPNAWGLCDMSGNAVEWVNDWFSGYYGTYGDGSRETDPPGPTGGTYRIDRSGGFEFAATRALVATCNWDPPASGYGSLGARVVRTADEP